MNNNIYAVKELSENRLFEASGANRLFEKIVLPTVSHELIFDFNGIDAISTSYAGRFLEHIEKIKTIHPILKIRVINAKEPVRKALQRKK